MPQELAEQQSIKPLDEQGSTTSTKAKRTTKKSEGLGDTIAKVTEATGIDKLVHAVAGEDCGCDERRKKLNSLFPYAKQMSPEAQATFRDVLMPAYKRNRMTVKEQNVLLNIWSSVFGKRPATSSCGSCVLDKYRKLEKVYHNSCEE